MSGTMLLDQFLRALGLRADDPLYVLVVVLWTGIVRCVHDLTPRPRYASRTLLHYSVTLAGRPV